MDINRYNNITKVNKRIVQTTPKAFIPKPTEGDYSTGYIIRYFVQSVNNKTSRIVEVNSSGYSKFSKNPFYNTVDLDWRITGDRDEVKRSNKASIRISSDEIPKLKLYLPNLLQFHKKS